METQSNIPLEDTILTIEIENKNPVELVDLTNSFLSLGEEYKRFVSSHPEFSEASDVRLYIKEIRTGSVKADLIAIATTAAVAIPFVTGANSVIGFAKHLKAAYDYFLGKSDEKPSLQSAEYNNLSSIIEPVAKDRGSQINFITQNDNRTTVYQTFNIDSRQANEAQNLIAKDRLQLKEPQTQPYRKKVLYWYQAKNDLLSRTGDKGIIESISASPVKIEFEDDAAKDAMLHGAQNPFLTGYVVDISVETIQGKPVLYKVLRYHGRVEPAEQDQLNWGTPRLTE
ncbi:MAG: hypothetical protein QOK48_3338 [Blastocatellia bacterium]|jgi:hypothetical protein|nr:hypothetical protein [Blastocatellia bacterium]